MSFASDTPAPNNNTAAISTVQSFSYIFVATYCTAGSSVTSITDTAGLTWYQAGSWGYGGDVELWWARATEPVNDTITVNFSGSPEYYYVSAAVYTGIDWTTPYGGGLSAYVLGQLGTYEEFTTYIEYVPAYLGFLASDLGPALTPAPGVYAAVMTTDNSDTWSATSFSQITGVTGGDGFGTGAGTTTLSGIMGESQDAPSTGVSPSYPLPFTFAWVDAGETTFEFSTMARVDEEILSIDLKHEEGQIPTLEIEIKNPRIGLLNPSRKQWAWLAYQPPPTSPGPAPFLAAGDFSMLPNGYGSSGSTNNTPPVVEGTPEYVSAGYVQSGYQVYDGAMTPLLPPVPTPPPPLVESPTPPASPVPANWTPGTTIIPLFFGELMGVPSDLFAEKITLKFIARPMNYIEAKQAVAETLKIPGNYEPIFLDEKHRDEPDSILEGWSSLYHVDRVTQAVTASDVLVGEDGTTVFAESPPSALYKSLKVKIGQAPLTNVQVQANVHWTQRSVGVVNGPDVNLQTYTGTTFLQDWSAMHGRSLGAGWTVETTYVNDPFMISHTPTWHISSTQTFYGSLADYDCATVSIAEAQSGPALLAPSISGTIYTEYQVGICNPGGNPLGSMFGGSDPVNIPAKAQTASIFVPLWSLNCSWTLRYNAKRDFTEMAVITVNASTQAVLTSPTVEQDTLLIKMDGEVGEPLLVYDAWSDFAGQYVGTGQLIFPNDPIMAGGLSYQICTTPGVAGMVEPVFSDVPGEPTADNGVIWTSLGENPQSKIQRMTFSTQYDIGTILVFTPQIFDGNPGTLDDVIGATATYWICIGGSYGTPATTDQFTIVKYRPLPTESDQLLFPPAMVTTSANYFDPGGGSLGSINCTEFSIISGGSGGVTGMIPLTSVPGIPVGGTADNVTARFFFPSARGEESLLYGINRARAKIRMRARAVDVSWDCPFDMVVGMSCRQNATIFDPRLPGGVATGKVISYGMTASKGKMRGHVTIGCSVGYNSFGNPNPDISYSGAAFVPFDDGLVFPLTYLPCDGGLFTETLADQAAAIEAALPAALAAMAIENPPVPTEPQQSGSGGETTTTTGVGPIAMWVATIDAAILPETMESNPIGWTCEILPVTNGPFGGAYAISVTPLELPMGIDLTAASSEE